MKKEYDLEKRLLQFALRAIEVVESLPETKVCNHVGGQLLRSGTSVALNYGEAQSAESDRDFIHKLKVILKELRESLMSLRILQAKSYLKDNELVGEADELVKIFFSSIKTVKKRQKSDLHT